MAKLRDILDQSVELARQTQGVARPQDLQTAPTSFRPELDTLSDRYDANLLEGEDQLTNRIAHQSGSRALGNAVVRSLGELTLGTLEGFGYLADAKQTYDLIRGSEAEFTNWFSDIFKGLQEKVEEAAPVYYDKEFSIGSFTDIKWWAQSLPTIANSLSLLIPAAGAAKAASLGAKGIKGLARFSQIPGRYRDAKLLKAAFQGSAGLGETGHGVAGAIASRYMENTLEAFEKADAKYKELLQQGMSEEEARLEAGKIGRNVWMANMPLVLADFYQFQKILRPFEAVGDSIKKKGLKYAYDLSLTAGSEGLEEAIQYGIGEEAQGSKNFLETLSKINFAKYSDRPEFWESVALGAIGGAVFQMVPDAAKRVSQKAKSYFSATSPVEQNLEARKEVQEIIDRGEEERLRDVLQGVEDAEIVQRVEKQIDEAKQLAKAIPESTPARQEKVENVHKQAAIEEQLTNVHTELRNLNYEGYSLTNLISQDLGETVEKTDTQVEQLNNYYKIVDTQLNYLKEEYKKSATPTGKELLDIYEERARIIENRIKILEKHKEILKKQGAELEVNSKTPVVEDLAKQQVELEIEKEVAKQEYKELDKNPEKVLEEKKAKELEQLKEEVQRVDKPEVLQQMLEATKDNPEASDTINKKIQKELSKETKALENLEGELNPEDFPFTSTFEPQRLQEIATRKQPGEPVEPGETFTTPDHVIKAISTAAGITKLEATDKKTGEVTEVEVAEEEVNKDESRPLDTPREEQPISEPETTTDEPVFDLDTGSWEVLVFDKASTTAPEVIYDTPNGPGVEAILDYIRNFFDNFGSNPKVFFEIDKDLKYNQGKDANTIAIHVSVYKGDQRIPIGVLPSIDRMKAKDLFQGDIAAEANFVAFRNYLFNKFKSDTTNRVVQATNVSSVTDIFHGKFNSTNELRPIKEVLGNRPLILGVVVGGVVQVGLEKNTEAYNKLFGDKTIIDQNKYNPDDGAVLALVQMPNGNWTWHKTNIPTVNQYKKGKDRIFEILRIAEEASREILGLNQKQIDEQLAAGNLPNYRDWITNANVYASEVRDIVRFPTIDKRGNKKYEPDFNAGLIKAWRNRQTGLFNGMEYLKKLSEKFGTIGDRQVQVSHTQVNKGTYNDHVADRIESALDPTALFHSPSFKVQGYKLVKDVVDLPSNIFAIKEGRIETVYPDTILGIPTSKVKEVANLPEYDRNKDIAPSGTVKTYREQAAKYGEAASIWAKESVMSIDEAKWMLANPNIALKFVNEALSNPLGDGETLQSFAKKLLETNVSYRDTAQGTLFSSEEVIPEGGRDLTQQELDNLTETLGIKDRVQQSTVEGDNKVTVKWVTPDGKVFEKQRDAVQYELNKEETAVQPTSNKPVIEKYKGKIIYATPGSGKTTVAQGREDIVDGDEVLLQLMKEMGLYNDKYAFGQNIYYNRNKIEQPFQIRLRELANEGKTVLTGNKFGMDVADTVILIPEPKSVVERTKNRSNPITLDKATERINEEKYLLAKEVVELKDSQFIDDILFNEQELLDPLDGFNLGTTFNPDNIEFSLYDGDTHSPRISAKEWKKVRAMLPSNVSIETVNGLLRIGDINAWGYSSTELIKLSKLAPYGKAYHEAFHQVFTYLLTEQEQQSLREEVAKAGVTGITIVDGVEIDRQTEWLADKFADYHLNVDRSFSAKLKNFFNKIAAWIKLAFGYKATIDQVFALAGAGYFNNRSYQRLRGKLEFSRTPLPPSQERDLAHVALNIVDSLLSQFKVGGELDIAKGYEKAFDTKNLDKNLVLSLKANSVLTIILNQAATGVITPQKALEIVQLFRPGFMGYRNGQPVFQPGTEKQIGVAYDVVRRSLYTRGVNITFTPSEFQSESEFEYNEADEYRESWTTQGMSVSVKEKLTPRIRKFLYSIPNGETDSVGLGLPMTYDGSEMYSILQKKVGESTSMEQMVAKVGEAGKYHDFFEKLHNRLKNYGTDPVQNELATQLYHHLGQNQHPTNVTILGKRAIDSNRYTLLRKLQRDFSGMDTNVKYQFTNEENNTQKLDVDKVKVFLEKAKLPLDTAIIERMATNNELYDFIKNVNKAKKTTDKYYKDFIEEYSKYLLDPFQDSYLNVEGSRTYEWITSSFIGELIADLNTSVDKVKAKYGDYAALPLFENLGHRFKFILVDGIKADNESTGTKYSSFSDIDMWKTLFALADRSIYTVPILSDSPNLVGIEMPKYPLHQVKGKIADVVRLDKHKSIFNIDPNSNREDILVAIEKKASHQISLIKAELRRFKINEEYTDSQIENFVYNYMLNHSQLILATTGDPNFYGSPDKFFKRAKEIWSPGVHPSTSSFFEYKRGNQTHRIQPPSTMKMRVEEDVEEAGKSLEQLKKVLRKIGRPDLISKYEKVSTTDAQSYIDLISYRWREVGMGRWNHSKQAIFDIYEKGETLNHENANKVRKAVEKDLAKARKEGNKAEVERLEKLKLPESDPFQPFKPYYYDLQLVEDILTPVQKKDSEFLILPVYGVEGNSFYNPKYRSILEEMGYDFSKMKYKYTDNPNIINDRVIDVLTHTTAVKVGFGEGVHELKFDSWRLQQEVPAHHKDTDGIFGTQIMKLIIADIDPELEYSGIKGSELIKEYEELIIKDINRSYNKILGELEVRNDGVLDRKATFDKLVNRLREEVINRGLGNEYLEGLEQPSKETYSEALKYIQDTNLPLWHPLHSYRIEALMNSMFKKEITKQKFTNGYVFTNVSPLGFERQPKIVFKDDNSIDYYEAYAPIYDSRLNEYIDPKTGTIPESAMSKIPSDLLEGIVYRIPTEDKYSMFRIKIIGFLPADTGGIVLPNEVTTIAGLDYDIDSVKGFFKGLPPDNKHKARLQRQLDALREANPDHPDIPRIQEDIDNYPTDEKYSSDKRKIELMESVLRSEHMTESILTPGGYDQITNNNYYIRWAKNNVVRGKYPKYSDFAALDGRTKEKLLSTTTPYYSPMLQIEMARRMNTGKALIGGAAVNNVVHSMFQRFNGTLSLVHPFRFFGKEYADMKRNKDDNDQNISKNFASFLAAFVDNGKDPQAEYFNMNQYTAPVAYVMAHLGIPLDVIQKFLASKSIEIFVRRVENAGGYDSVVFKDDLYKEQNYNNLKIDSPTEDISAEDLEKGLIEKENTELGRKLLRNFLIYKKIAGQVQSFVTAAKLGDQGPGPTQASNIIKLRNIYDDIKKGYYKDHDKVVAGAINFLSTPSFMTEFVDKAIKKTNEWIVEYGGFPDLTSSALNEILTRLENIKNSQITEKELRHFYESYIEYLAYGHHSFKYDPKRLEAIEKTVVEVKSNPEYKGMKIIEYMEYEDGRLTFKAPIGTDYAEIQMIRDSWKKLKDVNPQLYRDLAYYAFQRDGFSVSLGSFTQYQPADIYIENKSLTDYLQNEISKLKDTDNANVKNELNIFMDQYIRNHYAESNFVKGGEYSLRDRKVSFALEEVKNKQGKVTGLLIPRNGFTNATGEFHPYVKVKVGDRYVLYKHIAGSGGMYIYSAPLKVDNKKVYDPFQLAPKNEKAVTPDMSDLSDVINALTLRRDIRTIWNDNEQKIREVWKIKDFEEFRVAAIKDPSILERVKTC